MATLRVFCEPGAPYTERNRPKRPSPSLQLFLRMMLEGTGVKLCASLLSQLSPTDDFGPTPPNRETGAKRCVLPASQQPLSLSPLRVEFAAYNRNLRNHGAASSSKGTAGQLQVLWLQPLTAEWHLCTLHGNASNCAWGAHACILWYAPLYGWEL